MLKGFKIPSKGFDLRQALSDIEDHYISQAVEKCGGNLSKTAAFLNLNRTTLVERIKKKELPFVTRKVALEITLDPAGEFTTSRHDDGKRWVVRYKGEVIAVKNTLKAVNRFMKEKINE